MISPAQEAHCSVCRRTRDFSRTTVRHGLHALATVCTLGLWAPLWLLAGLLAEMRPWRCCRCGWHKPEFFHRHRSLWMARVVIVDSHNLRECIPVVPPVRGRNIVEDDEHTIRRNLEMVGDEHCQRSGCGVERPRQADAFNFQESGGRIGTGKTDALNRSKGNHDISFRFPQLR